MDLGVGAGAELSATGAPVDPVVLLVEPSADEAERLTAALASRGIVVCRAETAAQAKELSRDLCPELIVMELALPDADGLVLCADLRPGGGAPVVVYTHQAARERVLSLRLGADDAIAKSADLDEVVVRIEVALRRMRAKRRGPPNEPAADAGPVAGEAVGQSTGEATPDRFQRMGDLLIDRLLGRVTIAGQSLYLSATEYRLLSLFLSRPGEVLSREELSELLFGQRHVSGSRSIDMHVRRLRAKLSGLRANVPALPAVRGHGYRLVPRGPGAYRMMAAA